MRTLSLVSEVAHSHTFFKLAAFEDHIAKLGASFAVLLTVKGVRVGELSKEGGPPLHCHVGL